MSNSSLSENASLINDLETPSTPPSSISSSKAIPESINNIHKKDEKGENVQQETDRQNNAESIENVRAKHQLIIIAMHSVLNIKYVICIMLLVIIVSNRRTSPMKRRINWQLGVMT